ncbi:hypothetical protein PV760_10865 [Paenarthrobacter sp. CC6]|uniref:hypothetical protein n=1 Tax=Paenarthrobacter sp. CC6 TaxID=3029184 RepID=UPI00339BF17F
MSSPSHDAVLRPSGCLFGARVPSQCGTSPPWPTFPPPYLMNLFLSKEKPDAAIRPDDWQLAELDVPAALGRARYAGALGRHNLRRAGSPDPEAARTELRERYLGARARLFGDTDPDRRFASTMTALMAAFAFQNTPGRQVISPTSNKAYLECSTNSDLVILGLFTQ